MIVSSARRFLVPMFAVLALLGFSASTQARSRPVPLDLDMLSGAQAEWMMQHGELTSVELTEAYLNRIAAINKAGPGLNAVTQINPDALKEAAQARPLLARQVAVRKPDRPWQL